MAQVYIHKKPHNGEVFYVGIGSKRRAYSSRTRNRAWNFVADKYGYEVELINDLPREDAIEVEKELIKLFGKRNDGGQLVNITDGGDGGYTGPNSGNFKKGISSWNKGKGAPWMEKEILDMNTGIFWSNLQEAANAVNMKQRTLRAQLSGQNPNKTNLIRL